MNIVYYKIDRPWLVISFTSDFQQGIDWLHPIHANIQEII